MHTDPKDPYGQDLVSMLRDLNVSPDSISLSTRKVDKPMLAMMYNMADCTVNISDAEGFGLSTFESLSCGTPIIVNMTGVFRSKLQMGKIGLVLELSHVRRLLLVLKMSPTSMKTV